MTSHIDFIVYSNSLSNQNSLHHLYERVFGLKYPSGHLQCQLGAASRGEKQCCT